MESVDKLREVAAKTECANGRCEKLYRGDLERIADLIDEEYEQVVGFYRRLIDATAECKNLEILDVEYMALPLDAERLPIHVGDVMEWPDRSTAEVVGVGPDTFFYVEDGKDAAEWSCASDKIHHYKPTVENVLREFALAVCKEDALTIRKDVVDEYAAKLQLKED